MYAIMSDDYDAKNARRDELMSRYLGGGQELTEGEMSELRSLEAELS